MNSKDFSYGEKRLILSLSKPVSWVEKAINRLTTSRFNPLYHLGTLAIFLMVVIAVTGIYLTVIYRPGAEVAYGSVERISANGFGVLVRGIHRYASDAFILVILLHALKTLVSGRFWGSRWVAWVSGWVMVILTWFVGVLGYWLVWDQRAQWITEIWIRLMRGSFAATFLATDVASSTFSLFVIAQFLHIFIPLGFSILIFVHVLRLARVRLVTPRWLMVISIASLVVVSLFFPVQSAGQANLDSAVSSVHLDTWYLGFLALLDSWGPLLLFTMTGLVILIALSFPWIARGRHPGPATVIDPACTGCTLCAAECPYRAIEMIPRVDDDESGYLLKARVYPELCTGCGICVGTCAPVAIELQHMPTDRVFRQGLLDRVERQTTLGFYPEIVFTCQRQAASGTLQNTAGEVSPEDQHDRLMCVLPCVGMVDPAWIGELNAAGIQRIVFVSCPREDCANREGPHWLGMRLRRHKLHLNPSLQWIETAPGDSHQVVKMHSSAEREGTPVSQPVRLEGKAAQKAWPRLPAAVVVLILLLLLALPVDFFVNNAAEGHNQLRMVIEHTGVIKTELFGGQVNLPEHATIDPSQIMGGERYPLLVQIWVDDRLVLEDQFSPTGLRKEGKITGFAEVTLPSGEHLVEVRLKDDGEDYRVVFREVVSFQPTIIPTLIYDQSKDVFFLD